MTADEPPRALKRADLAVSLAPQDAEARTVRATALAQMKRYEEAAQDARIALKIDPSSQEAAAVLRLTAGRSSGGGVKAAAGDPSAMGGDNSGGPASAPSSRTTRATPRPDFSGAQGTADKLKADELMNEAGSKISLGDAAAALPLLDRALALDPKNARVLALRSRARLAGAASTEAASAALADAKQAVALDANEAQAHLALAHALKVTGAPAQEVLDALRTAVELDPTLSASSLSALARRSGDDGTTQADATDAAHHNGSAAALFFQRLPEAAKQYWPWLALVGAAVIGVWLWVAKRQLE